MSSNDVVYHRGGTNYGEVLCEALGRHWMGYLVFVQNPWVYVTHRHMFVTLSKAVTQISNTVSRWY